jgi:phosphotransferase system enzyme I (PtsI)
MERFDGAVAAAASLLRDALSRSRSRAEGSILDAYLAMITDETLHEEVERRVRIDYLCAEWALSTTIDEMAEQLGQSSDAYLAERRHDIEFVGQSIMQSLAGHTDSILVPKGREPGVLVAHDLSPAETVTLSRDSVLAIVTEVGTRTSHTSILARALEIPAVVGVKDLLARVGDGDMLVVDGLRGRVMRSPAPGTAAGLGLCRCWRAFRSHHSSRRRPFLCCRGRSWSRSPRHRSCTGRPYTSWRRLQRCIRPRTNRSSDRHKDCRQGCDDNAGHPEPVP